MLACTAAFSPTPSARPVPTRFFCSNSDNNNEFIAATSRRDFLNGAISSAAFVTLAPTKSMATVISSSANKAGTLDALTIEEAEQRFRAGRESVAYLLKNYDEICEGGGDNVRRYLGTVGTTSGLFGVQKAMKTLADKADDIVEYTELATEIEKTIQQADGSSYMAIFTVTSTSGVPPEKYFKDAKIEIERCAKDMDELAAMINLKF
ncbi:hypothetical protein ACHAXS_003754 [Conticribra weissflogii]